MSDLDRLRREAVSMGYVLLEARQADKIVHHVAGIFTERMTECEATMTEAATQARAEGNERGAVGFESLARSFRDSITSMREIADACDRILMMDDSREVVMSYDEEGVVVTDYEYNGEERFATEREALPYFRERTEAVKAMSTTEG